MHVFEAQDVLANQTVDVLPAPPSCIRGILGQEWFGKSAALKEMGKVDVHANRGGFGGRNRQQSMQKVPAGEAVARLAKRLQARAARHQDAQMLRARVEDSLQKTLPSTHLMKFIQHQKIRGASPRLLADDRPILGVVMV